MSELLNTVNLCFYFSGPPVVQGSHHRRGQTRAATSTSDLPAFAETAAGAALLLILNTHAACTCSLLLILSRWTAAATILPHILCTKAGYSRFQTSRVALALRYTYYCIEEQRRFNFGNMLCHR